MAWFLNDFNMLDIISIILLIANRTIEIKKDKSNAIIKI